ncbi:hypothetical protein [Nocardioides pyridinolyticus]
MEQQPGGLEEFALAEVRVFAAGGYVAVAQVVPRGGSVDEDRLRDLALADAWWD